MSSALELQDVTRSYRLGANNVVEALRSVSLTIDPGDMVAIMGPSGSGKSTLMHIAGGLDHPDSGSVWIEGTRIDSLGDRALSALRGHRIGFVFQGFNLLSTLSASENVALAGEYGGIRRREATRRAEELLEMLGLEDRIDHRPSELSGGEQQRVAIARALVNRPGLLMADEPTGNLDTTTSVDIMDTLVRLNREQGMAVLLVTHDTGVASVCSTHVNMVDGRVASESSL